MTTTLSRKERKYLGALERRRDRLYQRLEHWDRGDPGRTHLEHAATAWAVNALKEAAERGILQELAAANESVETTG